MADHLPETDRGLPRVIVAQRVIDKIVRGALLYPGYETGEAMVGLIVHQDERLEPDIYILDTISPGEDAVRLWGKFEQGSDWQGDVLHWLHVNWEAFRDLRRTSYGRAMAAKWDMPLRFVGDWHKQPGDMIAPTGGDLQTAHAMIADPETPDQQLVAPIVTMYRVREDDGEGDGAETGNSGTESEEAVTHHTPPIGQGAETKPAAAESGGVIKPLDAPPVPPVAGAADTGDAEDLEADDSFEDNIPAPNPDALPTNALIRPSEDGEWLIRIDFWYLSKRLSRNFAPVTPIIWPDDRLPNLPPIAWHLMHPRRFDQEVQLLADAGYAVDIVRWDADGKPPYEICFSVFKPGAQNVFILVTPVDYPAEMPAMRVAPLVHVEDGEDVFEKLYEASHPLLLTKLPAWPWDSKRTLIELVWHIEKTLGKGDTA